MAQRYSIPLTKKNTFAIKNTRKHTFGTAYGCVTLLKIGI